ncbi:ATP-binding protein [Moraxella bovis]|uniref:histidine kinase n=1 Tax=Moraxella bovis TaxID=476 RepID=A0AAX3EV75_MORBO|nr:ATP-binding protein [Moraxella bovis]UYZ76035.1 phosphate regulon sensor histidine kinase PhoR [Moraxella bovis]UYZ78012.1 phosphate regulon sensor histidine kinase PhoR [Moraxella bovis]UYZ86498.1 phosphate regulon sensor histidine kinase PhoR [Moraxella bovis]UYZ91931.1 phosphate regulon sensor histidine kinase PhoR [Moraxella bovis]UYZ98159.1 phosphate regulon sensor histidine kinase PhoR [Moraxella bovis]
MLDDKGLDKKGLDKTDTTADVVGQSSAVNAKAVNAKLGTAPGLSDDFYQILESSDDMLMILDEHEQIVWHNSSALFILTAYVDKPIIGAKVSSLILNHEFLEKFPDIFHAIYQSVKLTNIAKPAEPTAKSAKQAFEFFGQIYCGEIYKVTLARINNAHNHVLLTVANHTYIHHLEQMRTDFVGNVSHEIRTPLTVLMGYIETFSSASSLEPKWQRGFALMSEQARRMNNLVNDLLMLSRLEHDDSEQQVTVDMPRLLMQVFDDARATNKEFGHLLDIHLDTERHVLGIEKYLYSAILNLVINAMKYTPTDSTETGRQGEISILWEETLDGGLLSIADNGIGIEETHLARLTERFYRVDSGRSRATGGTGLGLAIVKHVLHKHGASLHIDSVLGQGSTFKILFPKERLV